MVRYYEKQFAGVLPKAFSKKAYFGDFGPMEAYDGIKDNTVAFTLKTNNIPVTVRAYNTGANIGFGNGTSASSRFGNRTEIIYQNVDVNFTDTWAIHEGLDKFTVNEEMDVAVAERLALHAEALAQRADNNIATFINTYAGITKSLSGYNVPSVEDLFTELNKEFKNNEVDGVKVVKVNSDLHAMIILDPLATELKNGTVDISENTVYKYRDFLVTQLPDSKFPVGICALAYVQGMGKTFTGISTTRAIQSEDFDGTALQAAGKGGVYTLPVNYIAMAKVNAPTPPPAP